ncbi:unnamed protein product [Microthlaspi erraticum]|uniref:S-protein homolog n=1 Tax=Microthlaspi erraticum TaxID=1685480 RepID=A0A6D2HTK0_9BRAS|nr:unnamed protein product [Microthlaspi erraticum]
MWIRNLLHNGNDLIVHCKTAKEDMGYHRVHPTGSYGFLHEDSEPLDPDILWCHLWQGPNFKHHQVFDVFDGTWEAREDGIYVPGRYRSVYIYGWDVPITKSRASSLRSTCMMISLSLLVSSLFFVF